jgi:hypothetical protein
VRFRENVRFGPFSWVIAHDFQDSGRFFATSQMCTDSFYKTFGEVLIFFWTLRYSFSWPFSARLGAFGTENYVPKRKPE